MPTIAVIDKDSAVLALAKDVFEAEGFDVLLYPNPDRALDAFHSRSPDFVVADIRMPEMDGLELLRRLRRESDVPVIFLSSRVDEADELIALRIGADGFIPKPLSQRLLVERVKAVLRRSRPTESAREIESSQSVIERGHLRMDKARYTCIWKRNNIKLTRTEFLLLESLALQPGIVKSRDALMKLAVKDASDRRTIDRHVRLMRQKFRAVDKTFDEIKPLYGIGYRFLPSQE